MSEAKLQPVFHIKQIEAGGFADIQGSIPMEIALLMLKEVESYRNPPRRGLKKAKRKTVRKKQ
jgi:hypothetical protein